MDESARVATAKLGGKAAVRARAALVRGRQERWFRYALTQLLSIAAARDATQEAALRVLADLPAFDPAAEPFGRWAMRRVVAATSDAATGQVPPRVARARAAGLSAEPPHYRAQLAAAADGLTAVLAPVPPGGPRAVAVLRLMERYPRPRVAAALEITPVDVRTDARTAADSLGRPLRAELASARDWLNLVTYPGDLRRELFMAERPSWLVPAAVGTMAASLLVLAVAHHFRPPPATTRPTTAPSSAPTTTQHVPPGRG